MVLGMSEQGKISETLDVSLENIPEAAFVSKKCFMADRGYGGTVFSSGEGIVVQVNEEEFVAKLDCFLSVRVHVNEELTLLKLLGKGFYYSSVMDASGVPVRDFWSGFVKVQNREITDPVFFRIEDIVRKVILYKSEDEITVADFQRQSQSLPYTVIVPVYPQNGDMLLIQGEGISDIWHGHVHSTDYSRKTVDVYFFVESSRLQNVFVRETLGRHARNVVPWDSILGIAEGLWEGPSRWRKQT